MDATSGCDEVALGGEVRELAAARATSLVDGDGPHAQVVEPAAHTHTPGRNQAKQQECGA